MLPFVKIHALALKLFQHLKIKIPLYSAYENKELEARDNKS